MTRWTVADVMTEDAIAVMEDAPFKEIVDVLETNHINAVPVIDAGYRVVGLVSSADLVPKIEFSGGDDRPKLFEGHKHRADREKAGGTAAADLMTSPAMTVLPATTVVQAAKLMDTADRKHLPVVDGLGRLTGMVTRTDLLKVFLRDDADLAAEIVREVLTDVPGIDPDQVRVSVDDAVVTLNGQVDRRSVVAPLVRHVGRVTGVVDVLDELSYDVDDLDDQIMTPGRMTVTI
jgi:CBS-domain-containing membrane protein